MPQPHDSGPADPADGPVRVSILIPTLNEAENIDPLLEQLTRSFGQEHRDLEILFADADSDDGTVQKIEAWALRAPVRLVRCGRGGGLSHDVLLGAKAARGEVVVVMDADLSHPPEVAPTLADKVLDDSCDMAIGSRHVRGGRTVGWPLRRKITSRLAAALAWPIVDAADPMSGFFAVRREKLLELGGGARGFKIGLELLVRGGEDLRVIEVPITFRDRTHGQSKLGAAQVRAYFRQLFTLAGGTVSAGSAGRFAAVGLLGLVVDLLVFHYLWLAGRGLAASHIGSFLAATVLNFSLNGMWAFKGGESGHAALNGRGYARFMVVCMMALFLRGAVVAVALDHWRWPAQGAIVLGVVAAAVVNYFGNAFFVFAPAVKVAGSLRWRIGAIGVVAYIALLRFAYLPLPNLLPEEAYYWCYSQHMATGFIDHPPMIAWLISAGTALFGDTEFGVRIGGFLCWLVTAGFGYGLARNLFGKTVALRAVLLLSIMPMFFIFGFFVTPDSPLLAAWSAALYFLERALLGERRWGWWGAGVAIGLGLLSKYTIALLMPATLAFLILDPHSRRWLRSYEPYAAMLLALLLFSPVIVWNAQHHWASFAFQSTRRLAERRAFSVHVLAIDVIAVLTPIGVAGIVEILRSWTQARGLDFADAPSRRRSLLLVCLASAPLAVFLLFSLSHEPKFSWTGPLWLALIPVLARNMPRLSPDSPTTHWSSYRALWPATVAVCTLLFGGLLHYLVLGLPFVGSAPAMALPVAWKETAKIVQQVEDDVEARDGKQPLVVGLDRYFIASELAFYGLGDSDDVGNTTSRHLFGHEDMMFTLWFAPKQAEDRTLILFTFNRADLLDKEISRRTTQLGEISERDVKKGGRVVAHLFYRVAQGYHAQL
jgi:dolichol-phosphate mannosyltransferase